MPGQLRRAILGDMPAGTVRLGVTDLVWVRLDHAAGDMQLATLDGASTMVVLPAADAPVWVQASSEGAPLGWRVLWETLPA